MASDNHGYLHEYQGEAHTLSIWIERLELNRLGLTYGTLYNRIELYGWSVEKAFTTPVLPRNRRAKLRLIEMDGKTMSVAEWAKSLGISVNIVYGRLYRGWSAEDALLTPPSHKTTTPVSTGKKYECNGESHTLREWSELRGIHLETLRGRMKNGWPLKRALEEPVIPLKERWRKKREA